jgi:hypothetical protein
MNDVLNLKIGSNKKKVKITRIEMRPCADGNPNKRFYLFTESEDGAEYKVNEIWTRDHENKLVVKSLWLNFDHTGTQLLSTSLLAKFLQYLKIDNVNEMIGKELLLEPKPNGFMAIVAYDENTV